MRNDELTEALQRLSKEWGQLHWLTLNREPVPLSSSVAFLRIGTAIRDELADVDKTTHFSPQGEQGE